MGTNNFCMEGKMYKIILFFCVIGVLSGCSLSGLDLKVDNATTYKKTETEAMKLID